MSGLRRMHIVSLFTFAILLGLRPKFIGSQLPIIIQIVFLQCLGRVMNLVRSNFTIVIRVQDGK